MDEPRLLEAFAAEYAQLAEQHVEIPVLLTPLQMWALIGQVQLALRHPQNDGATATIARAVITQLAERVALTPALQEVYRRGWDPAHDR